MADWLQEPIRTDRWRNGDDMTPQEVARYAFGRLESLMGGPQNDPLSRAERAEFFREKANDDSPDRPSKRNAAKLADAFGFNDVEGQRRAHPTDFADISGAELNRQKAMAVQQGFEKAGLPAQQDTGPLSTVFKMANLKVPRQVFSASSRRKTRNLKKKRTKKTRKH